MVMTREICFILGRVHPLSMPSLRPTLLHNNLTIYQSLLGTRLTGTCVLLKIMGFRDKVYGFESELCHFLSV